MIFIAGDIHGTMDIGKVIRYFEGPEIADKETKEDYLLLLGDTSICWDDGGLDSEVREILRNLPVSILFIDGNHENFDLLNEHNYEVDIIVTHTGPELVASELGMQLPEEEEELANYLQQIAETTEFTDWYCGHYHEDVVIEEQFHVLMDEIVCVE